MCVGEVARGLGCDRRSFLRVPPPLLQIHRGHETASSPQGGRGRQIGPECLH